MSVCVISHQCDDGAPGHARQRAKRVQPRGWAQEPPALRRPDDDVLVAGTSPNTRIPPEK